MKKYFEQLRPLERRLVVGVGVMLVLLLNWVFIWPHFSDWRAYRDRRSSATLKLHNYQATLTEAPELRKKLKKFESVGEFVELEDQGINFMRNIQMQSAQCGVELKNTSRATTRTNDAFFVEQIQNINVLATEDKLVDFLYKLGSGASMVRVRDLALSPDPPRQRLAADIRLVASYQKNPTTPAAKTATAKAK